MNEHTVRVSIKRVREALQRHLIDSGYSGADAHLIAAEFIENEVLGESHQGLILFKRILDEDRQKEKKEPKVTCFPSLAACDAGGRFVHPLLERLLDDAIPAARKNGLHLLAIKNCTCFIKAAYPVRKLLDHKLIGVCVVYVNYKCSAPAPIGSPIFGTNPIAIGIPAGFECFIFDSATTAASWNKLRCLSDQGVIRSESPLGLDKEGAPTSALESLTAILPWGGNRGLGLLMAVEMLAGSLLGFPVGIQKQECDDSGILILALDPEKFGSLKEFQARNEMLINSLRTLSGGRVHIPGAKYSRLSPACDEIEVDVEVANDLGI